MNERTAVSSDERRVTLVERFQLPLASDVFAGSCPLGVDEEDTNEGDIVQGVDVVAIEGDGDVSFALPRVTTYHFVLSEEIHVALNFAQSLLWRVGVGHRDDQIVSLVPRIRQISLDVDEIRPKANPRPSLLI